MSREEKPTGKTYPNDPVRAKMNHPKVDWKKKKEDVGQLLKTRRVLGVQIVGEGATELIHIGQAVLVLEGELSYFIDNVFNYPTLAEAYKIAALDAWNRLSLHRADAGEIPASDLAVVNG